MYHFLILSWKYKFNFRCIHVKYLTRVNISKNKPSQILYLSIWIDSYPHRKDTEPLNHSFMYSLVSLISVICSTLFHDTYIALDI